MKRAVILAAMLTISATTISACDQQKAEAAKEEKLAQAVKTAENDAKSSLKLGQVAPDFTTLGALGGKETTISLKEKLKEGPLVLYFFPKAFTPGCTAEAHKFSEKAAEFKKHGANIIGMSGDNIEGLKKFSVEECRNMFPVAQATPEIAKAYNVTMVGNITKRTTFVIAKDGTISMIYENADYSNHVNNALAQVTELEKLKL